MINKMNWTSSDFMTHTDMNRIESNISELTDSIRAIYSNVPDLTFKTNRGMSSIDYLSDINRIESNLEAIRKSFVTPPNYGGTKMWSLGTLFDFRDANRLETNTYMLNNYVRLVVSSFRYCGSFNTCGEEVLP